MKGIEKVSSWKWHDSWQDMPDPDQALWDMYTDRMAAGGSLGALGGGLAGGTAGYIRAKGDEERDMERNVTQGAGIGALGGQLLGGGYGYYKARQKHKG